MNKSRMQIDTKKAFTWGAVVIIIQMGVFYVIWMNPFVNEISIQFSNDTAVKPYEYFGGMDNWMQIRTIYNVVLLAVVFGIFLMFYTNIPGNGWKKGANYGLILSLLSVIPAAFNKWTLIVYPNELIILQLVNGIIGVIVFGILSSLVCQKFSIIKVNN